MPYDPAKPADGSPLSSAEMRDHLGGLHEEIQARVALEVFQMEMANTSSNTDDVGLLAETANATYSQAQMQTVIDKLDELITALRRN